VTHLPPDTSRGLNGKVVGVQTGLRHGSAERVIIADDDVRYDEESLHRVVKELQAADLVGPQNVFDPMPWHASWDTARSLLNRACFGDYPGTFAIRRSTYDRMGGYSSEVLFENLELMRTVRANGGTVRRPLDIFVARRPPTARRFFAQRVRQAYDDCAQPWRLAMFLPVLPAAVSSVRGQRLVLVALISSIALAERGRRRAGGAVVFPARTSLLAPVWVLERSVCSWLALGQRVFLGGVSYAGTRVRVPAHSHRRLVSTAATNRSLVATGRPETAQVGAIAERLEGRSAAPAQSDGRATRVDDTTVETNDGELSTQDKRAVRVGRDHSRVGVTRVHRLIHRHHRGVPSSVQD